MNPDFEIMTTGRDPVGWNTSQKLDGSVFRTVADPSLAHSATTCIAIEQRNANQSNYAVWTQEIPAKARTTYRFSFWIRTEGARPLTPYNEDGPSSCGTINPLDVDRKEIPSEPPYPQSANVFMTHDWQRVERSFHTPDGTASVRIGLALGNTVGTVSFDSVSFVYPRAVPRTAEGIAGRHRELRRPGGRLCEGTAGRANGSDGDQLLRRGAGNAA